MCSIIEPIGENLLGDASTTKTFYCWAQDAALSVTNKIMESNSAVPEVNVCSAAMRLMLQILNWDFQYNTNAVKHGKSAIYEYSAELRYEGAKRSDCVLVQPGPSWRDVLITSCLIGWLLSLYGALRKKFSCEVPVIVSQPLQIHKREMFVLLMPWWDRNLRVTNFVSDPTVALMIGSQVVHSLHLFRIRSDVKNEELIKTQEMVITNHELIVKNEELIKQLTQSQYKTIVDQAITFIVITMHWQIVKGESK